MLYGCNEYPITSFNPIILLSPIINVIMLTKYKKIYQKVHKSQNMFTFVHVKFVSKVFENSNYPRVRSTVKFSYASRIYLAFPVEIENDQDQHLQSNGIYL